MEAKRKGENLYAIRIITIGTANTRPGEHVIRYFCPTPSSKDDTDPNLNFIEQASLGNLISSNKSSEPKIYTEAEKEQMLINAYDLQQRLDRVRKKMTLDKLKAAFAFKEVPEESEFKRIEEYFVKPVVFSYNQFLIDCQIAEEMCSVTHKKMRQEEKVHIRSERMLAKIRGEIYYREDIDKPE